MLGLVHTETSRWRCSGEKRAVHESPSDSQARSSKRARPMSGQADAAEGLSPRQTAMHSSSSERMERRPSDADFAMPAMPALPSKLSHVPGLSQQRSSSSAWTATRYPPFSSSEDFLQHPCAACACVDSSACMPTEQGWGGVVHLSLGLALGQTPSPRSSLVKWKQTQKPLSFIPCATLSLNESACRPCGSETWLCMDLQSVL